MRHPYFRDLRRDLSYPFESATQIQARAAARAADVVYVGDFHADPSCQRFAADLLEHLAQRSRSPIALGVEFIFTRQQEILDLRQVDAIDDASFLRRIHYRDEWGYPWEGFRDLLDRAKRLGVPVHALDRPPRGGFEGLARRDDHAARRIVQILTSSPRTRMLVLFGESHLARGHMPAAVTRLLARRKTTRRSVVIFQDPEPVYWSALARGGAVPEAVRLRRGTFAVFHTPPLARYEGYRQVLERWRGDTPADEDVDLTPAVHHLIDTLVTWMGIRPERHSVRHRVGWSDDLQDAYPEVYGGAEARHLLRPILREHGRTPAEIREARRRLARRDALYDPRSNTFFLVRYLPGPAAGEAARFLRVALSGRLHRDLEPISADPAERAYGAAYDEALAYLGARLVDPASDVVVGVDAASPAEHRRRAQWIAAHREFEATRAAAPPPALLRPLRGSRELRRRLAHDLGRHLGIVLYERVIRGELSSRALRGLFTKDLDPPRARYEVIRLLRGKR